MATAVAAIGKRTEFNNDRHLFNEIKKLYYHKAYLYAAI